MTDHRQAEEPAGACAGRRGIATTANQPPSGFASVSAVSVNRAQPFLRVRDN